MLLSVLVLSVWIWGTSCIEDSKFRAPNYPEPEYEVLGGDLGLTLDPQSRRQADGEEDGTWKHLADPSNTRIMGRDGLCVTVKGFTYHDDNPVILHSCNRTYFKNQLWEFQEDGRIVSLDMCLAASGDSPGSIVMIHECNTTHESTVKWAISDSGTLSNTHSGLVLTAESKQLTLDTDKFSSFQAWQRTNNLTAVDVYIHGEDGQCIHYDGQFGIFARKCHEDNALQKWRLYPDSTIRPVKWLGGCLELQYMDYPSEKYNTIKAAYCDSFGEFHRWIFTSNGSIMNLQSKLVVDKDIDYPADGWLKAAPFKGGTNQQWTLEYIKI